MLSLLALPDDITGPARVIRGDANAIVDERGRLFGRDAANIRRPAFIRADAPS